jgi:hypothetical protein
MKDKSKLYTLIFIFSVLSLVAAIVLKASGVTWFDGSPISTYGYTNVDKAINFVYLVTQGFLIIGCCTWIAPKALAKNYIPFIPLNALLLFVPINFYLMACFILTFSISISINPKLSGLIKFILGVIFVNAFQLALIWIKYNIFKALPLWLNIPELFAVSIDQFVLLGFLYYVCQKWGEKYVVVLFGRRD